MKKFFFSVVIVVIFIFAICLWQLYDNTPSIKFTLLNTDHDYQIRYYPAANIAQTEIIGNRDVAVNNGFAILADYISGNNQAKQKISMLTPVTVQEDKDVWLVTFFMPASIQASNAPKANNAHIHLRQWKAGKYIALRFSGLGTSGQIDKQIAILENYIRLNHLRVIGDPIVAFYNPPFTLPFLRRNEVLFRIT